MDGSESDGSNTDSSSSSAVKHILTACELRRFGLRLVNFADDRIGRAKHASQRQKFVKQFGVRDATACCIYEDLQKTHIHDARVEGNALSLKKFLIWSFAVKGTLPLTRSL
jgi:hypothetical protein